MGWSAQVEGAPTFRPTRVGRDITWEELVDARDKSLSKTPSASARQKESIHRQVSDGTSLPCSLIHLISCPAKAHDWYFGYLTPASMINAQDRRLFPIAKLLAGNQSLSCKHHIQMAAHHAVVLTPRASLSVARVLNLASGRACGRGSDGSMSSESSTSSTSTSKFVVDGGLKPGS